LKHLSYPRGLVKYESRDIVDPAASTMSLKSTTESLAAGEDVKTAARTVWIHGTPSFY